MKLLKLKPSLWPFIREAEADEEEFKDVPIEDENTESLSLSEEEGTNEISGSIKDSQASYLPKARNPLYCKAERSCLWELVTVCNVVLSITSSFLFTVNPSLSPIGAGVC